ncbi:hypothetical protein EDC14_1015114 [Hydrogenispora ethanolica]|jgi:hypothetical protein|uniref:Uncharacterized protein n=1 Tax=Hydrogenispora ethanolica TaxID=1082276 RepID=A0A4R1RK64_HYDET|nr:hypothetical protein [Hydrogenispora ethanolica]TCL66571.1 hypothetical protein EDC14_1015114 [Hydrogenispora ethanolica]
MLKPVDLQTIMPRTFELEKVQQTHNSRPVVDQHEFAKEMLRQSQLFKAQVQQGNESAAGQTIQQNNPEKQKSNGRRYRRFNNKTQSVALEQPEETVDQERGHLIDIKI